MPNFEIHIGGYTGCRWRGGAGSLSAEEKETARKFGVSDEQYLRSKMEVAEKSERLRMRAGQLGELVETLVQQLGTGYRLVGVSRNIDRLSWTLQVNTPSGVRNVVVPWELADDVLDSGTASDLDRLRNVVFLDLVVETRSFRDTNEPDGKNSSVSVGGGRTGSLARHRKRTRRSTSLCRR